MGRLIQWQPAKAMIGEDDQELGTMSAAQRRADPSARGWSLATIHEHDARGLKRDLLHRQRGTLINLTTGPVDGEDRLQTSREERAQAGGLVR